MTKTKILFGMAACFTMLLAGCGGGGNSSVAPTSSGSQQSQSSGERSKISISTPSSVDDAGKYSITVWCPTEILSMTKAQLAAFSESMKEFYDITFTVQPVSEATAAKQMIDNPSTGADIFFFAQDQLASLKTAGVVYKLNSTQKKVVTAEHTKGAQNAAKVGTNFYAYPLTTNGYFMYYDKSVVKSPDNMADIIKDCKAASKKIRFNVASNGFYTAAYYYATKSGEDEPMCYSNWTLDTSTGKFTGYEDNIKQSNPDAVAASKGIQTFLASGVYSSESLIEGFETDSSMIVSGLWDYKKAKEILGDNLGCAELPSYTVDDTDYHLGSFSGYKLVGVKPQSSAEKKKLSVCNRIAQFLTGRDCQEQRFDENGWGPTNVELLKEDKVKNHEGVIAFNAQDKYATPQGQYPSNWWSALSNIASNIKNNPSATEQQIKNYIKAYEDTIPTFVNAEE